MAVSTPEYKALKARLKELAKMLPVSPGSATASPTPKEADLMSAFVVLTHAACEEYMEKRALQVADKAKNDFDAGSALGRVGKHLCVFPFIDAPKSKADLNKMIKIFGAAGFGIMVDTAFETAARIDLGRLLNIGYQKFRQSVEQNNGASLKYQFKLLSRIGFDLADLNGTFSSRISQLAELRGDAAHKRVVAAHYTVDAATLKIWAVDLSEGYGEMDKRLSSLIKRRR